MLEALLTVRGAIVLTAVSFSYLFFATGTAIAQRETELRRVPISAGNRAVISEATCRSLYCSHKVCFNVQNGAGEPATAKVIIERRFLSTIEAEAIGPYCSETIKLGPLMPFSVSVEANRGDIVVSYNARQEWPR